MAFDLRKLLGTIGSEVGSVAKSVSPIALGGAVGKALQGGAVGGAQQVINEPRRLPAEMVRNILPMQHIQKAQMQGQPQNPFAQMQQGGQGVWGPYGIQDANQVIRNGQPFLPQANVYGDMIDQGLTPHMDPKFYGYPPDNTTRRY